MIKEEALKFTAVVTELFPNAMFKVKLENDNTRYFTVSEVISNINQQDTFDPKKSLSEILGSSSIHKILI